MKGKYTVGSLIGLGLAGSVGGISYYSVNYSSEENLEQKVKDLAKKISNHIKNYTNKENWKSLWSVFLNLQKIKKNIDKYDHNSKMAITKKEYEDEIKELKKKIEAEKENYKVEEVYKEIEKAAILKIEIDEIWEKLINERDELGKKISESSKNFEKFKNLNLNIQNIKEEILENSSKENFNNIKSLEEEISEKQKEIEDLKNKEPQNLKEKIKIWLDLDLKLKNLTYLSNILSNICNSEDI